MEMVSGKKQPVTEYYRVGTTATQPAMVGSPSTAATTTYTASRVTDGTAWDLSAVQAGDVILTGDGYKAIVETVDDGNDYIDIDDKGWIKDGAHGRRAAAVTPTDGQDATIFRIDGCQSLQIRAHAGNSDEVYVGFGNTVTVFGGANPGMPVEDTMTNPQSILEIVMPPGRKLDLTEVYVIAASTQHIQWLAVP